MRRGETVALKCDKRVGTCVLRWKDGTTLGPIAASVEMVDGTRWATSDLPRHELKRVKGSPKGLATEGMREVVIRHFGGRVLRSCGSISIWRQGRRMR